MKNRLLSLALALLMLVAVIPTTAFAANNNDYNAAENFVIKDGVLTQYNGSGYNLHVIVPDGVKEIGNLAFVNHAGIISITLPDSVQKLGLGILRGCDNLTDIYIGSGLRELPEVDHKIIHIDAFYGLPGLQAFHISASNPYYKDVDGVLFAADGELVRYPEGRVGDYRVPEGTTKIRTLAFASASGIGTLTIPGTVEEIATNTFTGKTCKVIVIENGVKKLGYKAFNNCEVEMFVIPPSVTDIGDYAFIIYQGYEIYGQSGSAIETYCQENNIPFSTVDPFAPVAPALDTASAWAHDSIQGAYDKGFIPVDIQGNYTGTITREEFCRLAMKYVRCHTGKSNDELLVNSPDIRNTIFADTRDWDVVCAHALGIINGTKAPTATEPGTFDPNGKLTREQAAVMIMNTCKVLGIGNSNVQNAGFTDMATVSGWAVDGVNFVKAEGIMSGTGNNAFSPKGTYTRQESIVTFDRIK